jgi:L-erythro-3,5-diaminohexanoate dehydrogenase
VLAPAGVLPQAAWRLDASPELWPDEVRVRVERLNLDAASFRQLREATGGAAADMRAEVCRIVAERGKMQNPATGSGGMLTGVVEETGPDSPSPGGDHVATSSPHPDPARHRGRLERWDGR